MYFHIFTFRHNLVIDLRHESVPFVFSILIRMWLDGGDIGVKSPGMSADDRSQDVQPEILVIKIPFYHPSPETNVPK